MEKKSDILENLKQLDIPKKISYKDFPEEIDIRGSIHSKYDFKKLNEKFR